MIEVFTANTPNGVKVTIALEELGVPYKLNILNLGNRDQKKPDFLKINPNGRIPAIIDHDGPDGDPLRVFESGAVLLYLAEKFGKLYFQCAKALIRSALWQSDDESGSVPTAGDFIKELDEGFNGKAYDEGYAEYAKPRRW